MTVTEVSVYLNVNPVTVRRYDESLEDSRLENVFVFLKRGWLMPYYGNIKARWPKARQKNEKSSPGPPAKKKRVAGFLQLPVYTGGADETRTRDLRRDRPVIVLKIC